MILGLNEAGTNERLAEMTRATNNKVVVDDSRLTSLGSASCSARRYFELIGIRSDRDSTERKSNGTFYIISESKNGKREASMNPSERREREGSSTLGGGGPLWESFRYR